MNNNLGLVLNIYYRLGKTFHLGFVYQPALLNLNNDLELIYEHTINLEASRSVKLFGRKLP